MDTEVAGASGLRPADGTVPVRQPTTTSNYHLNLFGLAIFGQEHTTFVLAVFIYLNSLCLILIVLALFIYLGSQYKYHSRSVSDHWCNGNV